MQSELEQVQLKTADAFAWRRQGDCSAALADFFLSASKGDDAWAMMSMSRSETARFGMTEHNGEIRSDVAQLVVSFDQHRLYGPRSQSGRPATECHSARAGGAVAVIGRRLRLMQQMRLGLAKRAGAGATENC
ncbi:hypothetical protein BFX04_13785 [Mammaliicoccus sciuri]|nr:hypothetical protein BFX04_13785 [Mammaliicoccus sciuri]